MFWVREGLKVVHTTSCPATFRGLRVRLEVKIQGTIRAPGTRPGLAPKATKAGDMDSVMHAVAVCATATLHHLYSVWVRGFEDVMA
jgi:hypothetical protein